MHKRAGWMAALAAVGLLCGGAAARAEDGVKVGQSIAACLCFLPARVADQVGILKRHGLSMELLILRGDAQEMQALASGGIDVGLGSGPGIGLISKGVPAKGVAVIADSLADMALIAPKGGVTSLDQLKGRKLGVSSAGSLTYWLARRVALHEGWEPTAIAPVSLGDLDANIAGLKSGAVDGIVFGVEAGYLLGDLGQGQVVATMDQIVPNFISHAMFATDAMIKDRPDVLRRFVAAWFETIGWMGEHRAETVAIATGVTKLPEGVMGRTYDTVMPTMSRTGVFNAASLRLLADSFVELGMLPGAIDPAPYLDTRFLPGGR